LFAPSAFSAFGRLWFAIGRSLGCFILGRRTAAVELPQRLASALHGMIEIQGVSGHQNRLPFDRPPRWLSPRRGNLLRRLRLSRFHGRASESGSAAPRDAGLPSETRSSL
jgi:hypothetical protein